MELSELVGLTLGPRSLGVSAEGVADFVEVTGDDPERWVDVAPPGYAAAALFVVAPELLARLEDHSVIHGEQTFTWRRPITAGSRLQVSGSVSRARPRGGVHFVGFDLEASDDKGEVLEGSSLFLISGESAPPSADPEREEPAPTDRGSPPEGWVGASRADLIRYAAATRDWNPIHWDHASAVAAGFPGVVVHGLLQASWIFAAASAGAVGGRPLATGRVRFRNPLLPGHPVAVRLEVSEDMVLAAVLADEGTEYVTARIEMADE